MKVGDLVRFLEVAPDVLASEVDTPMPVGVILERYTEELTIGVPGWYGLRPMERRGSRTSQRPVVQSECARGGK